MGVYVLNVAIEAAIVTIRRSDVVTRKAGFSYHDRSVLRDRVVVFLTQHRNGRLDRVTHTHLSNSSL